MKTYHVTMSTSHAHTLSIEAKNKQEAIEKSLRLSQEEILDQSLNTWDVDTFPMLIDCEEE